MPTFKGRWTARVEQDFEIEADDAFQASEFAAEEARPSNVVELLDIEIELEDE